MSTSHRYTSADLAAMPSAEGVRYEIVDGELHVSTMPHWRHQYACNQIGQALGYWSRQAGGLTLQAPGLIFSPDNDVAPDVVWVSRERLLATEDAAGHLRAAPEIVVEVISPGRRNERRDREAKLALYSRQRVQEYWLIDWRRRTVDLYRRSGDSLVQTAVLSAGDTLTSPLLPGFACPVSDLWTD